LFTDSNKTAGD